MNESVSRMVNQLFEAVPCRTEELEALREELLNNCQEHYEDLVRRDYTEAEAEKEIADSLAGMEEVVAQAAEAARESAEASDEAEAPEESPASGFSAPEQPAPEEIPVPETGNAGKEEHESGRTILSAEGLQAVKAETGSQDLCLESSPDGMIHVLWDPESDTEVYTRIAGDTLEISTRKRPASVGSPAGSEKDFFSYSKEDGRISFSFQNFASFVRNTIVSGTRSLLPVEIRVQLPAGFVPRLEVSTRSGDVDLQQVSLLSAVIHSTSGDLDISPGARLLRADLETTSGDIRFSGAAEEIRLSSLSGDLTLEGASRLAEAKSTSGDLDLLGEFEEIRGSSVSGDVDVCLRDPRSLRVLLRSTSGDVDLQVPSAFRGRYTLSTASGDIMNSRSSDDSAPASVEIRTVSGDITVR